MPTAATGPNTNGKKAIVAGARQLTTVVATIIHTANDQAIQIARTGARLSARWSSCSKKPGLDVMLSQIYKLRRAARNI
jgi:hypothetical protein